MKTLIRTLSLTLAAATVAGIGVAAPKMDSKAAPTTKPAMKMAKHTTGHKSHKKRAHHRRKHGKMSSKMSGSKTSGGKMGGGKMGGGTAPKAK
jgi:hypothetical protein